MRYGSGVRIIAKILKIFGYSQSIGNRMIFGFSAGNIWILLFNRTGDYDVRDICQYDSHHWRQSCRPHFQPIHPNKDNAYADSSRGVCRHIDRPQDGLEDGGVYHRYLQPISRHDHRRTWQNRGSRQQFRNLD